MRKGRYVITIYFLKNFDFISLRDKTREIKLPYNILYE